jgi:hypothetical protein
MIKAGLSLVIGSEIGAMEEMEQNKVSDAELYVAVPPFDLRKTEQVAVVGRNAVKIADVEGIVCDAERRPVRESWKSGRAGSVHRPYIELWFPGGKTGS